MAFPGGGLTLWTPNLGTPTAFADGITSVPILTPTVNRTFGIALNSPYPVNRDSYVAPLRLRLTWKFLAISNDPTNPWAAVMAALDSLWNGVMMGQSQIGTVQAYTSSPGGTTCSFPACIVPSTIALAVMQPRHQVPEISFDVVGPFT